MTLMDEFYARNNKTPAEIPRPKRILFALLADVTDRRGWRQQWDQFDDEIREEILEQWLHLITEAGA